MAADKFAVARLMAIELQAGDIGHDRLQQRLALKERQACRFAAIEMQKIEGVKDQAPDALPVRRGLGLGEAWKAVGPYSAQFAVEVGRLRPHGGEDGLHDGIFVAPVEAGWARLAVGSQRPPLKALATSSVAGRVLSVAPRLLGRMLVRLDRGAVVSQLRAMRGPRLAGQRH